MKLEVGDIVYVERHPGDTNEKGQALSDYNAGEKIVLEVGENTFRAIDCDGGYGSSTLSTYRTMGSDRWRVANVTKDPARLHDILVRMKKFVEDRPGTWVESVYAGVEANRQRLKKAVFKQAYSPSQPMETLPDGIIVGGVYYRCPPNQTPKLV